MRESDLVEKFFHASAIGIARRPASLISLLSHPDAGRIILEIEPDFVGQLSLGFKEFCLDSFLKKLAVFFCTIGQEQAAASGNLERTRSMLIGADLAKEPDADF